MVRGKNSGVTAGLGLAGPTVSKNFRFGSDDQDAVKALFAQLGSKRVFVDLYTQEVPKYCVQSVLDVRSDATQCLAGAGHKALASEAQKIISECNAFLSAAGEDGAAFVHDFPRFAGDLSRFRTAVGNSCKRLAFDFKVDPPIWVD